VRTKGTYLSARYQRIKSRRGHAKATVATGHKILTAHYHVLQRGVPYNEPGEALFYRRAPSTPSATAAASSTSSSASATPSPSTPPKPRRGSQP
jgi:transposase